MALWFQKPGKAAPPVLDLAYLNRLACHIGEAETRELLADGMLELSDRLDRLAEHAARDEVAEIAEIAHDIAGAAGHLGLSAMSLAAVEACRFARADDPPSGQTLIAPLLGCRGPALEALGHYCAGETAADNVEE